jgi:hypothetical protein
MSQELRQTSFSGGEFAPALHSRSDLEKYAAGLVKALNAFVSEHGTLKNRPGTLIVGQTGGAGACRLVRFQFSDDQSYVLEVTGELIRIISNGGLFTMGAGLPAWSATTAYSVGQLVTHDAKVWRCKALPATNADLLNDINWGFLGSTWSGGIVESNAPAWVSGTTYARHAHVTVSGSVYTCLQATSGTVSPTVDMANWLLVGSIGSSIATSTWYDPRASYSGISPQRVVWVGTGGWFNIPVYMKNAFSVGPASSADPDLDPAAWTLVGNVGDLVTIVVPWASADLPRLKFAQSGDVISTAHRSYEPSEIRRRSHYVWEYGIAQDRRPATWRQYHSGVTYAAGDIVRAITTATTPLFGFFRSLVAGNIGQTPSTSPTYWEAVSGLDEHLPPSDCMFLSSTRTFMVTGSYMAGMVTVTEQVNQVGDSVHPPKEWAWVITAVYGDGVESVASEPLMPRATYDKGQSRKVALYPDMPATLTWLACPGAVAYRFYRGRSGFFGYVGEADPSKVSEGLGGGLFQDEALAPDWARQPPTGRWPFGLKTWEALQAYVPEDLVVTPGGLVYRCAVGGLSGNSYPTGQSGLVEDGCAALWTKVTAYVVGQRVMSNDCVYE